MNKCLIAKSGMRFKYFLNYQVSIRNEMKFNDTCYGVIPFTLKFILKVKWFGKTISVYAILLIPFFIVNGILTGTGIKDAVVEYNSLEIIGLRLLTIPIEDFFYGFELFLLNIFFYKIFQTEDKSHK